ncbi:MAG: hypothetical protein ACLP8A_12735 [Methylovirgula sp.]
MAALKGYFDESGKENDPQFANSAVAAAGYVTTVDSWRDIEVKWNTILSKFEVPYLHMREFAHSEEGTPFEGWKRDEPKRSAFLAELIEVIKKSDLFGVGAVVRLPDLRRFNQDFSSKIEAYPLSVYACMIELTKKYPEQRIETVWDKVDKHGQQIATARDYAETDGYYGNCGKEIAIFPLKGSFNSRQIPALQIADLAVYELLKSHRDKNDWYLNVAPSVEAESRFKSLFDWVIDRAKNNDRKSVIWPDERKSFLGLFGGRSPRPMEGFVWEYTALVRSHEFRKGVWSTQSCIVT